MMWRPITLSSTQRKAADRVGGAELLLPWPPGLPLGASCYDVRDASPTEHAAAEAIVRPAAEAAGLVVVRSQVAIVDAPPDIVPRGASLRQQRLIVLLIGRRWVHASTHRVPGQCWYGAAIERA